MQYKYWIIAGFIFLLRNCVATCLGEVLPDSVIKSGSIQKSKFQLDLWGELYNETISFRHDRNNWITFSHVRQGVRLKPFLGRSLELYALIRYGKDLHRDFWNNRAETGLGGRVKILRKLFLLWYFEFIRGYYIKVSDTYPQPNDKNYKDIRSGLIFWKGWDRGYSSSRFFSFPFNSWGDIYSDVSYFQTQRNNIVGYFHIRSGWHLLKFWKSAFGLYGIMHLTKDINRDFWNNRIEIGPGILIHIIPVLSLKLYVEWPYGRYFGIEGKDPNPYPQHYQDKRMGVIFWIGW